MIKKSRYSQNSIALAINDFTESYFKTNFLKFIEIFKICKNE